MPIATLAAFGESYICQLLIKQNWQIIARNHRHIGYEIDIAAVRNDSVIIVEVKTRRSLPKTLSDYETLLPERKRISLMRGARFIPRLCRTAPRTVRIDLALVIIQSLVKKKHPASQPDVLYFPSIVDDR